MRNKILTLTLVFLCSAFHLFAQTAFSTVDYVDVNKIEVGAAVHGDLMWNPGTQLANCEFPKGTGKHAANISTLWISGYDAGSNLHVAAQTYRQNGNDYWPGPLDAFDTLTYASSQTWARIWKVSYIDIANFKAITTHTTTNTPPVILEWPAKNNPYAKGAGGASLTITTDMAPFVDVNNDGNYNPMNGDYPAMKGDQMLWWIFSDNGPTHNNHAVGADSKPLKVIVKAMAYAYNRSNALDNVVYYEYNVTNKSTNNYSNFRMAVDADIEIGYYVDDYIGFDSTHRMVIGYNGDAIDGSISYIYNYGASPPVTGITLLEIPGDNSTTKVPAGSFMYFNNDGTVMGNPSCDTQYNNYMRAKFRDGMHLKNDFTGIGIASTGRGAGANVNYVFPGNPGVATEWSECISNNPSGDRRGVLATNDYTFTSGSTVKFVFALLVTDTGSSNGCPNVNFTGIKNLADTVWKYYGTPLPPKLSVNTVQQGSPMVIYPNPAKDVVYIEHIQLAGAELQVMDITGKKVQAGYEVKADKIVLNTASLTQGMYFVSCKSGGQTFTARFVKE